MTDIDPAFESLLEFLRDGRGFDYTGYRRPSLMRRFDKRLQTVGSKNYDEYKGYLETHPEEYSELFNTILINVTGFFRDQEAWDLLAEEVIPRSWRPAAGSARCECGRQVRDRRGGVHARDAVRRGARRRGVPKRAKIYATDVDDHALAQARDALFTPNSSKASPRSCASGTSRSVNHGYQFRAHLRRAVIFGRNDLLQDPPISRVDLLICRNTLMYLAPRRRSGSSRLLLRPPAGRVPDARQGRGAAEPHAICSRRTT